MAKFKLTATIEIETEFDEDDPDEVAALEALKGDDPHEAFDEIMSFEGYEVIGKIKVEEVK